MRQESRDREGVEVRCLVVFIFARDDRHTAQDFAQRRRRRDTYSHSDTDLGSTRLLRSSVGPGKRGAFSLFGSRRRYRRRNEETAVRGSV